MVLHSGQIEKQLENVPIGVILLPASIDEINVWDEQCLDLLKPITLKIIKL